MYNEITLTIVAGSFKHMFVLVLCQNYGIGHPHDCQFTHSSNTHQIDQQRIIGSIADALA
jgi:hypothetical protein